MINLIFKYLLLSWISSQNKYSSRLSWQIVWSLQIKPIPFLFRFWGWDGFPCKAHQQNDFWTSRLLGETLQSFPDVIKTNQFVPLKQQHSLSIWSLSLMKFSHTKQIIKIAFWTKLFGGKIFEGFEFLEIIIKNSFSSSNQAHPCLLKCWARYGFSMQST